jgi:Ca-activated chloride channel family protein
MKWMFTATAACLLALSGASTQAQNSDQKAEKPFQVKKNVFIPAITTIDELKIEALKLFEDDAEQAITGFSNDPSQLYLEIVIDDSGSMSAQRDQVKAVGKFVIQNLSSESQVQVIRFASHDKIQTLNEWSSDKSLLAGKVDEASYGSGDSPIIDSLLTALDEIKKTRELPGEKRFAIVLISDCGEGGSRHSETELMQELAKANVPVFVIGLIPQFEGYRMQEYELTIERFAHRSALASGGSVYFPLKGDNAKLPLTESLDPLAAELRSQYVVTYTPTNQAANGKERKLRIDITDTLEGFKRQAVLKPTYVVPR